MKRYREGREQKPSAGIIHKLYVGSWATPAARRTLILSQAIFHEGSKGYLCCKRRVLEFSEFLKIEGCTEGKHLFVGSKKDEVSS